MYNLKLPIFDKSDKEVPIIIDLLKEVFGYNDTETQKFSDNMFMTCVAKNITKEQLSLAIKPFYDNEIHIYITNNNGECLSFPQAGINLAKESPKDHYYDHPVVSRDQLVDPFAQKEKERQENYASQGGEEQIAKATLVKVTCPYCQSTNTQKISGLSKAGSVALWGIFALGKTTKQWHCNNCKSDF